MKRNKHYTYIFTILILFSFHLSSCKKEDDNPELTIKEATQTRTTTESTMKFQVVLSKPSANTITVDYTITDGTAVSSVDFVASSGTLTIPPDQTLATYRCSDKR